MNPILRFRDVSFGYGDLDLIQSASFDLEPGSCTALIGPNGAGKTTMLRLAGGTLRSGSGSIFLNDEPLHTLALKQVARTVALVPQQLDVPFQFTVRQVVEQGRTPYLGFLRGPMSGDRVAVDRALELADVAGLQHRVFNELSGGERQRVKIALGLAQQPKLLLLDEPTQNLDIGRQMELIDLFHFLRLEGITIFASIHDLQLVEGNFSSVVLLSPHIPLMNGKPEELLKPTLLEKAFDCPPRRHPLLLERMQRFDRRAG
ncbi:ABC transporter ATP-binding protein [Tunturiibacter lichenicola]|jgi:iron complex transport system ATP-binding protein|uniref:ABC transporter ATP-binding protein n=1 Tax=Tunturiibacter lichenicola TaxID=2051959 RepID=UPI003D9B879F